MFLRFLINLLRFRGSLRGMKGLQSSEIRSILIVELTRLGDVVAMLPAVRLISRHYPNAVITLLVDEQYAMLLRNAGLTCEVRGVKKPESPGGFAKAVMCVRALKVDLALSMSPPKRNAAVTLTSGASRKVGYLTYVHSLAPYLESTPVEAFGCSILRAVSYGRENIEERSLKVCRAIGISTDFAQQADRGDNLFVVDPKRLSERVRLPGRPFVVVHPFSGWEFRSWSLENFRIVVQMILDRCNHEVVFLCEKREESKLTPLKGAFGFRHDVHFVASDDLLDTAVLLKEASLVLCNDSGPLHLAAGLGTQVVALFGPASPELTAPRRARGMFLYKEVECSPCDQCTCVRPANSCMTLISPEEVFESISKQLLLVSEAEPVANV